MSRDRGRYIRSYHRDPVTGEWDRWQLWEWRDGRYRRVGTAHSEEEYRAFLRG